MRVMHDPLLFERLIAKTKVGDNGCLLFTGFKRPSPYPSGRHGYVMYHGTRMGAHRAMWISIHGPLTPDLHVCHTCDIPHCVNPDHLWLGTHAENMSDSRRKGRNFQAAKTHCLRGHPFDEKNTYRAPNAFGGRSCRICGRLAQIRYENRKRGIFMSDETGLIPIAQAAAELGIEEKRLRGYIYRNGFGDPIGDAKMVYSESLNNLRIERGIPCVESRNTEAMQTS